MKTRSHGSVAFTRIATLFPNRPERDRLVMFSFVPVGKEQEYTLLLNAQQIENLKKALKETV